MTKPITDLFAALIPCAVRARTETGDGAREAAAEAVRAATAWFLNAEAGEMLRGHEFVGPAVVQIVEQCCHRHDLSRDTAGHVGFAVDLLREGLVAAAFGEQHVWGAIRPRPLKDSEIDLLLRGGIQGLVNAVVFIRTGDILTAAKAQDRVAGKELDLGAMLVLGAEIDAATPPCPTSSVCP